MTAQASMTNVNTNGENKESASIALPELTDEDLAMAYMESNLDWARDIKENAPLGVIFNHCGSQLYRVSHNTIRCHQVAPDSLTLLYLSLAIASFAKVGMTVEVTPYTLVVSLVTEQNQGAIEPSIEVA